MESIKEDFMDILEKQRIKPVFQPIVSLKDARIVGYEALSRIVEPQIISSSEELFRLAGIYGKLWELEQLCRKKILEKYHDCADEMSGLKLFLNVSPMVIHDKEFCSGFTSQYLSQYDIDIQNIIFEVTEKNAVEDVQGFKDTIRHYKMQGYQIAIDDAGSCYSGLNLICDVVPHYLKLDCSMIHDIDKDTIKYAMVKSMVDFANLVDIQIVAEGIETEDELRAVFNLGVHNVQGYYLKKPNNDFKKIRQEASDVIQKLNRRKNKALLRLDDGQKELCAVIFSIGNYKAYGAYCEKYGDDKGDEMLNLLKETVISNLTNGETAVMLNRDTVLAAVDKDDCRVKCETIVNVFEKECRKLYSEDDLNKGYIEGVNKHGEKKRYPMVFISSEQIW